MLEKVILRKYYLEKNHLHAPMLAEREAYIKAMYNRGCSHGHMVDVANYLLRIIEFLHLTDENKRLVLIREIEQAGEQWSKTIKNHPMKRCATATTQAKFILISLNWLGDLGMVKNYNPSDNILSSIFSRAFHKRRYLTKPLLEERISYVQKWKDLGATDGTLRNIAQYQMHVMDYLPLTELRSVRESEIVQAAKKWETVAIPSNHKRSGRRECRLAFIRVAKGWLEHLNMYVSEPILPDQYQYIESYLDYLLREKGYSCNTIESRDSMLKVFFRHLDANCINLSDVTIRHIDAYFKSRSEDGCNRKTIAGTASVLRDFFRYAEEQSWCKKGLSTSIGTPRCYKLEDIPSYIAWDDLKKMLKNHNQTTGVGIRDHAILLLLSIYGLRCSEVRKLKLCDLDWKRETIHLTRAKGCRPQELPLVKSVGEAIIKYLREVRQNESGSEYVFLCSRAPYRPMTNSLIYKTVRDILKPYGINTKHYGPHTLRHTCATHLVNSGHSMKEVSDLLGHQMLETTRIYAKVDLVNLRKVANMNWEDLL
ncbi:hypothetical protein HMPREF1069_04950 [Bacteroides ovatus CL02T12C04]|nr:hypothetical protein HMPREF1069_06183 [Bacteroides ovatus CL02T12C04]EIY57082.1 hypothetical protein HMPREF1069_05423 [Bacteroides ovatus CL02T12C04]EIY57635.1 hypothetical protein HMPREF1069_04950 [Bacteroides ovatus CL02T12C04]